MENYKILSVKDDELESCAITIRKAFAKNAEFFGFTKENYPSSGAFITLNDLKEAKSRGVHMYAAWVGGTIAGYVQLEKKENGVYSFQKFAVLPEYQQIGLGKALISFCKNKATIYGGKKLTLIMIDENQNLKNMYLSNGFEFKSHKSDNAHPFLQAILEMPL